MRGRPPPLLRFLGRRLLHGFVVLLCIAVLEFLLSDRSSYITGQMIHPNGGQLIW